VQKIKTSRPENVILFSPIIESYFILKAFKVKIIQSTQDLRIIYVCNFSWVFFRFWSLNKKILYVLTHQNLVLPSIWVHYLMDLTLSIIRLLNWPIYQQKIQPITTTTKIKPDVKLREKYFTIDLGKYVLNLLHSWSTLNSRAH
jgi:hypothetical protein